MSARLQIKTDAGWQWIFAWVVNGQRIATTDDARLAVKDEGDNRGYFESRSNGREIRSIITPER